MVQKLSRSKNWQIPSQFWGSGITDFKKLQCSLQNGYLCESTSFKPFCILLQNELSLQHCSGENKVIISSRIFPPLIHWSNCHQFLSVDIFHSCNCAKFHLNPFSTSDFVEDQILAFSTGRDEVSLNWHSATRLIDNNCTLWKTDNNCTLWKTESLWTPATEHCAWNNNTMPWRMMTARKVVRERQ